MTSCGIPLVEGKDLVYRVAAHPASHFLQSAVGALIDHTNVAYCLAVRHGPAFRSFGNLLDSHAAACINTLLDGICSRGAASP